MNTKPFSFGGTETFSARPAIAPAETAQTKVWKGDFGRDYTDRNTLAVEALDSLYLKNYGLTRTAINRDFLRGISHGASFLEVGCNSGNQLLLLQRMGYSNFSGIELQPYALDVARSRAPNISLSGLVSSSCNRIQREVD